MARKKSSRNLQPSGPGRATAPGADERTRVSPRVLAVAAVLILAGYFFLKRTEPAGRDLNAALSALFLLSGYLLVPCALIISRRSPARTEK